MLLHYYSIKLSFFVWVKQLLTDYKPEQFLTFLISLFGLLFFFLLFARQKEEEKIAKEEGKARHRILCPHGGFTPIRPFLFLGFAQSLLPRKLVLRTQTVLGIKALPCGGGVLRT